MSTSMIHLPDWIFQQSAVVPYRIGSDGLEVLLVTSRRGSHWVLPKGIVDPGLTASESAAKEAKEEAGVEGAVGARSLGKYRYKKWGGTCKVEVFPMEVTAEADDWLESQTRKREWMTVAEATKRLSKKGLRKIVRRLPEAVEALRAVVVAARGTRVYLRELADSGRRNHARETELVETWTRLGFVLTPVPETHLCCGSAGTYSLTQPALSRQLRDRKVAALESGKPDLIATANVGCQLHLEAAIRTPVVHWLELLR